MTNNQEKEYFQYLQRRSPLGLLYRKFYLYPRMARALTGRVLDVGCGIGDFLAYRAGTTGLDVNPYNVSSCREKGLDARLIENERYPFSDNTFDGVVMDNVLEHIENPSQALREIRRVLKPGGRLVIGVPGKRGYDSDPDHKAFYRRDSLQEVVEREGFVIKKMIYTPWKSSLLSRKMRQAAIYGVFQNL